MTGNDLSGLLAGQALKELDWRALEDSEDLVTDRSFEANSCPKSLQLFGSALYAIRAEGKNFPTRHWVWICEFHGQRLEAEAATLDHVAVSWPHLEWSNSLLVRIFCVGL